VETTNPIFQQEIKICGQTYLSVLIIIGEEVDRTTGCTITAFIAVLCKRLFRNDIMTRQKKGAFIVLPLWTELDAESIWFSSSE
jgi:hypothetical protein